VSKLAAIWDSTYQLSSLHSGLLCDVTLAPCITIAVHFHQPLRGTKPTSFWEIEIRLINSLKQLNMSINISHVRHAI
jgi:hypothetical protein